MSIQLAKNEKVLKSYEYATAKSNGLASASVTKTLTVTNKRIIHREIGTGANNESVKTSEMPITSAKYVNTMYRKVKFPVFLVFGIIFALFAIAMFIALPVAKATGILPLVLSIVFILVYVFKKQYALICTIDTDTPITPVFVCSSVTMNTRTRGLSAFGKAGNRATSLKVVVNPEMARQMADEIGSVIMAAINGDYDEKTEADVK